MKFDSPSKDFFFILPGQKSKRAKQFCAECPVKRECLEFALIYNEKGIWGGTTEEERERYPWYIIKALRDRERETVGMESRNMDDFIPRQQAPNLVVRQVTVTSVAVQYGYGSQVLSQSRVELLREQSEVLDLLFAQTNALLESLR